MHNQTKQHNKYTQTPKNTTIKYADNYTENTTNHNKYTRTPENTTSTLCKHEHVLCKGSLYKVSVPQEVFAIA